MPFSRELILRGSRLLRVAFSTLVAVYGSAIRFRYPRRVHFRRITFNCIDHEDFKMNIPLSAWRKGICESPRKTENRHDTDILNLFPRRDKLHNLYRGIRVAF